MTEPCDEAHKYERHFEPLLAPEAPAAAAPSATRPAHSQAELSARARRRQRLAQFAGGSLALLGVAVGGGFAWSALRPITPPDVFNDPFGDVLGFALLDADFNKLPIEERIALLKEMAERFRNLGQSDSALVAAFAAGITGRAREQLKKNMQTLMVDLMDHFALLYAKAPPDQQEAALEDALLQMFEMMQELRPDSGERQDAKETLREIKEDAARNEERRRERASSAVRSEEVTRMFEWVQNDVAQYSDPNERARVTRFMRDASRYMRGKDVKTGKPKR